jgi:hypothetical protein
VANESGRGVNLPQVSRNTGQLASIPQVRVATADGIGKSLFSIGNMLGNITKTMEDRLDVKAQVDAGRAGTLAGMDEKLPQLQDETTIKGRAFNMAARESAITRMDMAGREQLKQLEDKFKTNPKKYQEESDSWLNGVNSELMRFDPKLAQRYEADFTARRDAHMSRIEGRHEAIVRDQQLEGALRMNMAATDEIAEQAQGLFSGDPQAVTKGIERMTSNAARLVDVSRQIGPDGQYLFTAQQRIAFERKAEETVSEQVALAWMAKQPDVLTAWDAWNKGEAKIDIADDAGNRATVPLRDMLGPKNYQKAQGAFMEQLRQTLSLNAQVDAARERDFKRGSDTIYTDLTVLAQEGKLSLSAVEQARTQLEPEKYTALRALARGGGAAVSDGNTLTRLQIADLNGEDIRSQLQTAFNLGDVSRDDFLKLFERNNTRLQDGRQDAITAGRDYVGNSLGRLAKDLGFAQSLSIPRAEAEYQMRIEGFVQKEERQPTLSEALTIGQEVTRRYSFIDATTSITSLPLPKYMTPAEKLGSGLNEQKIQEVGKRTRAEFLKRNGGNVDRLRADPAYLEEMRLLKDYSDFLKVRDNNAAQ